MQWKSPFVIYRVDEQGHLQQVYQAPDLKDAKYWLTYIAQVGDVLCKTPAHPKADKSSSTPTYWSHKEQSGQPLSNQAAWELLAKKNAWTGIFPMEQAE